MQASNLRQSESKRIQSVLDLLQQTLLLRAQLPEQKSAIDKFLTLEGRVQSIQCSVLWPEDLKLQEGESNRTLFNNNVQ